MRQVYQKRAQASQDVCVTSDSKIMSGSVKISFGERIKTLRLALGISQEELAYRAGVHRTYMGAVERGERNVSLVNIIKIAKALEVSTSELFQGVDE